MWGLYYHNNHLLKATFLEACKDIFPESLCYTNCGGEAKFCKRLFKAPENLPLYSTNSPHLTLRISNWLCHVLCYIPAGTRSNCLLSCISLCVAFIPVTWYLGPFSLGEMTRQTTSRQSINLYLIDMASFIGVSFLL